jgi:hypothetical protein
MTKGMSFAAGHKELPWVTKMINYVDGQEVSCLDIKAKEIRMA